jgi:ribosomal 50S subunit-associated protein YjgA (DUF615 family)
MNQLPCRRRPMNAVRAMQSKLVTLTTNEVQNMPIQEQIPEPPISYPKPQKSRPKKTKTL